MALWTEAAEACNKIRTRMADMFYNTTDELGLMEALHSKENLDGMEFMDITPFDESEGRRVTVYANSYQRATPDEVNIGGDPEFCVTTPDKPKYTQSVVFDDNDYYHTKFTVSNDRFRAFCRGEDKGNFILNEIRNKANAMLMKMEQNFPLSFLVQKGTLVGGGLLTTGALFVSQAPQVLNNGFISNVRREAREMEQRNGLFMVGNGLAADFADLESTALLCCNNQGYELNDAYKKTGLMFYRSPNVQIAMGANVNDVLIWGAGTVIPAYWIKNRGSFDTLSTKEQRSAEEYQGVSTNIQVNIGSTNKNLLMDLDIRYDNCGRDAQYIFTLGVYSKIVLAIATETYAATDRLYGTNGAFLGRPTSI